MNARKERVFVRTSSGGKKLATVDMRKEEHQFVIDGFLVDEVLSQIPANIKILGGMIKIVKAEKNGKVLVPNVLRKYGVTSMYRSGAITASNMAFDQISKEGLKRNVKEACSQLGADRQKVYFRYLLLSNGKGNVRFTHTTKEIKPDETDLRKKLRVLGADLGSGQVQSVIADLNARKYKCVIKEQPVKFVMCYKE